jgi:hypothetical protein
MSDTGRSRLRHHNHRAGALAAITVWGCFLAWLHVAAAQSDPLGPDKWPVTVEDTVRDLLARMPAADLARVKRTKQEDLIQFHLGWGTGIRNHYGLWRGNEKLILSACGHPCHPDDASMKIIEAVWQELQNQRPQPGE